ncbi:hypothetical protein LOZ61_003946 [Ophidiomyces ophidiicola]|uniref:Uncharacterized protein n=1 Tax=Ophidiomyces ophidiicola TaxID=1387563 RepID=A0ACB8UM81_9EURO|nr:hypothetical protein LOZ64_005726 [Ophidiomyces ophidiicola]KAI1911282.1 hypothetical protein LOZ61_003946 [Ophidiomyces ophidiicola]KAI1923089.1 hypothetical protein LOZ60_005401 [Ophidiomyces ophidiicola]KAI2002845.1 hypothetical protein LOZ50_004715 [Ophidiomyces ophidiicola]KAI2007655.1 hypothetical protein LOZ49_004565 [Ophidiomyces ophidiicola]
MKFQGSTTLLQRLGCTTPVVDATDKPEVITQRDKIRLLCGVFDSSRSPCPFPLHVEALKVEIGMKERCGEVGAADAKPERQIYASGIGAGPVRFANQADERVNNEIISAYPEHPGCISALVPPAFTNSVLSAPFALLTPDKTAIWRLHARFTTNNNAHS